MAVQALQTPIMPHSSSREKKLQPTLIVNLHRTFHKTSSYRRDIRYDRIFFAIKMQPPSMQMQ